MINPAFALSQLSQAVDCIQRVLANLRAETAAPSPEGSPQITTDRDGKMHYDDSQDHPAVQAARAGRAEQKQWLETRVLNAAVSKIDDLIKRVQALEDAGLAVEQSVAQLRRIVLAIDPEACARQDLLPF